MGIERASGPQCSIDSCTSEHGWDIFLDLGKWHHGMRIALGGMSELFQSGEGVFVGKIQDFLMRSDDLKIESGYSIEKSLIGSKPRGMFGLMIQDLPDRRVCFCHIRYLLSINILYSL